MLRRTTNAIREARDQSPVVQATTAFGSTAENGEVRLQQSPDRGCISTAGLNPPSRAAEPFQAQLDQHDSYVYGLRVSANLEPIDLASLASGEAEFVEELEQDLTGAFPEGAGAVSSGERTPTADTGLSHVRAEVKEAVLQLVPTGSVGPDASATIQVVLDQNEALRDRVGALEKSRSCSVTSAHTAIEGTGDTSNAADSSGPGGSALVQSSLTQHATAGGRFVGLGEGEVPGLSPAAGVLFGGSSQAIAASAPKVRAFSSGGKGSVPASKSLQGSRASQNGVPSGKVQHALLSPALSASSLVATFGQGDMSGSAAVVGSLLGTGSVAGPQAGHMRNMSTVPAIRKSAPPGNLSGPASGSLRLSRGQPIAPSPCNGSSGASQWCAGAGVSFLESWLFYKYLAVLCRLINYL